MLILAGAGLGPGSVSDSLKKLLGDADLVVVETYTSPMSDWVVKLAKAYAREVTVATRDLLEERSHEIVRLAAEKDVVVLVPGDPMIATTHSSLVVEALGSGVKARVIPAVSGPCASMSASGLQFYRFGRKITIPGPWRGVGLTSVALWLLGNLCLNLHTLFLLDVSPSGDQLSPADGARAVLNGLKELLGDVPQAFGGLLALAISVGEGQVESSYSTLSQPQGLRELKPSSLIVPSHLHVSEREFLQAFHGVDEKTIRNHELSLTSLDACRLFFAAREKAIGMESASS